MVLLHAEVQPYRVGTMRQLTDASHEQLVASLSRQVAIGEQTVPLELSGPVRDALVEYHPRRSAGAPELDAHVRAVCGQHHNAQPLGARIDRVERDRPDPHPEGQPPRLVEGRELGRGELWRLQV